jgi:acyl carrier protein
MPKTADVLVEVNRIRAATGKRALAKLLAKDQLRDDLELDSLDLAELTVRLQAKFGVDVFAKRNLRTVGDVVEELEIRSHG